MRILPSSNYGGCRGQADGLPAFRRPPSVVSRQGAFTMVEIALCLAIIGFALVAIIGVLPTGLNVQRDNREETIINQDAEVWMNALRNGARGFDDLTNYVIGITNHWQYYNANGSPNGNGGIDGYGPAGSSVNSLPTPPPSSFALNSGSRIVGILSTPKYTPLSRRGQPNLYQSNYITGYFRALSGLAATKSPQDNATVLDSAFGYKLIVENINYVPVDSNGISPGASRHYYSNLQTNSHDLRLTFRWPLLPNSDGVGNGRQTFRAFAGGHLVSYLETNQPLYFIDSATYTTNAP